MRWPTWQVVLFTVLGVLLYLRSPIDLLPDRMGPLGFVDDLVLIGVAWVWLQRRLAAPTPPAGRDTAADARIPDDPYELLAVAPGATPEEITRAYREQMKRYHPDRVADLGEELQRMAHERTIAIQRAYDAIGRP